MPVAGTYDLRVRLTKYTSRAKCNLYVDGSGTVHGAELDLYNASGYAYQEVDEGNVTFSTAGDHTLKFQVSAPGAGGGWKLAFDSVKLIGASPAAMTPPVIIDAAIRNNHFVVTFSTTTNGQYDVQRTFQLTPSVWSPVVTNLPGTGAAIEVTDTNAVTGPQTFYRVERGM